MVIAWVTAIFAFCYLGSQLALNPFTFALKRPEVKVKIKNRTVARLENLTSEKSKVLLSRRTTPGVWFVASTGARVFEGDRLFVPPGSASDIYFRGETARLSLPSGAVFQVGERFELSKLQRQLFYFETEQATVNASKHSFEANPQFARAYWMRPGKAPARSSRGGQDIYSSVVEAKEVEVVKPEGDIQIQSSNFPYLQTILLGQASADKAELTAYLFDEDAGFQPIWSQFVGSKKKFEIPIPQPGVFSFVALSDDQLSSTRHVRLFVQRLEESE